MRSVLFLCLQDFKRLLTNALFWVLTVTLILIILVVNLALPEQFTQEEPDLVTYNLPGLEHIARPAESREALVAAVKEENTIGLVAEDGGITIVHPNLSQKTLNAIMLALDNTEGLEPAVKILNAGEQKIPFNKRMVPIFICFEALIVGFTLGGALMLAEKEDETVKALRIAPMGAIKYLFAKTLLFSVMATLYASLICVFCVGFDIEWALFLPLTFFGSALFTMIGLAFTTLFRDMNSWFFSLTVLLGINMLPVIPYSSPAFSPFWIRLIPSYPLLFSYERALFGRASSLADAILSLVIWCALAFIVSNLMVSKIFLKGRRGV